MSIHTKQNITSTVPSFASNSLNKEWLSMHQCIDDNCPVHFDNKTGQVGNISEVCHDEVATEKVENTRGQNNTLSISTGTPPRNINSEECDSGFNVQITGAIQQIAECYNDERSTESTSESVDAARHQYKDNTSESDHVIQKETATVKPRFLCTWLKNNVNIDSYPFYKKAVYYGDQKTVRKDFTLYNRFVTNQIWATHRYIGDPEQTKSTTDMTNAFRIGIKASKSHETLSENIEGVLKDIPSVNISDLILKYAFLFYPHFISKTSNKGKTAEDKYPYGVQRRNLQTTQSYQLAKNGDAVVEQYNRNHMYRTEQPTNNINVVVCDGAHGDANCVKSYHSSPYQTCFGPYSNIDNATEGIDPRHCQIIGHCDTPENAQMSVTTFDNKIAAKYCHYDKRAQSSPFSVDLKPLIRRISKDHEHFESTVVKSKDLYSLESSRDTYSDDLSTGKGGFPRNTTVSIKKPCVNGNFENMSPYLSASPLVSSPSFYHYTSPAHRLNQTPSAGQAKHFYTKRNDDPRLKTCDSNIAAKSNQRSVFYNCHTPDICSYPAPSRCSGDGRKEHGFACHEDNKRQTERQQRYVDLSCGECEDPLQGLPCSKQFDMGRSSGAYSRSPDSEIFYRIRDHQNNDEQCSDGMMDAFYREDRPREKRDNGSRLTTSLSVGHRSRSPREHSYQRTCHRPRASSRDRYSRHRSNSRERIKKTSRALSSCRRRYSRSSPNDRKRHHSPENSRQSRENKHMRITETSAHNSDRKTISSYDKSHHHGPKSRRKSVKRETSRESRKREESCRKENESYTKELTARSSRSSVSKTVVKSYCRDYRQSSIPHSRRREDCSNRSSNRRRR